MILYKIIFIVCGYYGVAIDAVINSRRRDAAISMAREMCMYIMHKVYKISLSAVSKKMNRTVRLVIYQCVKVENYILMYEDYEDAYKNILKLLSDANEV